VSGRPIATHGHVSPSYCRAANHVNITFSKLHMHNRRRNDFVSFTHTL
jgi:hypothetical protein